MTYFSWKYTCCLFWKILYVDACNWFNQNLIKINKDDLHSYCCMYVENHVQHKVMSYLLSFRFLDFCLFCWICRFANIQLISSWFHVVAQNCFRIVLLRDSRATTSVKMTYTSYHFISTKGLPDLGKFFGKLLHGRTWRTCHEWSCMW